MTDDGYVWARNIFCEPRARNVQLVGNQAGAQRLVPAVNAFPDLCVGGSVANYSH